MSFNVDDYKEYYFNAAKDIFSTPSPSGYYREIEEVLKAYAKSLGVLFERTKKGCFVLTLEGKSKRALGFSAHADTLGAMIRAIKGDKIFFSKIGGPILSTFDGEYCTVITREGKKYGGTFLSLTPSVHVYEDCDVTPHNDGNMYVRLDENVKNPEDFKALGIQNGDYIALDAKTEVTKSGFLKSRFIDDKASVAAFLTAIKIIKDANFTPDFTLKFMVTMYEEVGHGASWVPPEIERLLCVDMGCIGKDLTCTEHMVSICAKDSHGPYDYDFTSELIALAKKHSLNYAVDVYPHYGSDADAMWAAGHDIPAALIGTGVHASHGMERTHFDGIKNTLALMLLFIGMN